MDLKIIDILPDLLVCLVETSKSTVSSIAVHEKRNVALLRWLDPFFFLVIIPITLSSMNWKDALNDAGNLTVPTVLVGQSFKTVILYRLSPIEPAYRT